MALPLVGSLLNDPRLFWDRTLAKFHILGRLAVGAGTIDDAAIVEFDSTTQGFLPPRMTTTQRDAISGPVEGLVIYNTTTNAVESYDGAAWLGGGGGATNLNGLSDVVITAAASGDILRHNGSDWVDYPDSNYAAAAHASTHENGGADEVDVTGLSGLLADPQTPDSHVHSGADITSGTVAAARLDVHASSHQNGGADEINVAGLSGVLADAQPQATSRGDSMPHQTGLYYAAPATSVATGAIAQSQLRVMPFFIPAPATYTRIGINTTVTPLSTPRLGIYANSGGLPGALILDAGTVDGTTTSFKEITISQSLPRGWYWIGASNQGAAGIVQYGQVSSAINAFGDLVPGDGAPGAFALCYYKTGVTGALPDPYGTPGGRTAICHLIWLKI